MHSSVYYYLVQVGALTFSSDSLTAGGDIKWGSGGINLRNDDVAYFMGARVIVDDMLTPLNEGTSSEVPASLCTCSAVDRSTKACSKSCVRS